ncbi:hypothetical protein V6Z77_002894 [Aspergillus fumigatus]
MGAAKMNIRWQAGDGAETEPSNHPIHPTLPTLQPIRPIQRPTEDEMETGHWIMTDWFSGGSNSVGKTLDPWIIWKGMAQDSVAITVQTEGTSSKTHDNKYRKA